jgi:hypothetical protein
VQTQQSLRERSLEQLLWEALSARVEGLVVLRDRDGLRHGVWVHGGFVVGIHVAGRFDPLLDVLRRDGALSPSAYQACVEALWRSSSRSGALAVEIAGVARPAVRDALKSQAKVRMQALLNIADTRGYDAWLELRDVPATEMSVRMPLGSLLRPTSGTRRDMMAAHSEPTRDQARRQLRALARELHPDRHAHLPLERRQQLERQMAAATAAYHGFG